jgi:hypothetical protein
MRAGVEPVRSRRGRRSAGVTTGEPGVPRAGQCVPRAGRIVADGRPASGACRSLGAARSCSEPRRSEPPEPRRSCNQPTTPPPAPPGGPSGSVRSTPTRSPRRSATSADLRRALIEAATHAARDTHYRERYERTRQRLGRQRSAKVARIDVARRLAEAIWNDLPRTNCSLGPARESSGRLTTRDGTGSPEQPPVSPCPGRPLAAGRRVHTVALPGQRGAGAERPGARRNSAGPARNSRLVPGTHGAGGIPTRRAGPAAATADLIPITLAQARHPGPTVPR